jgi:hypothetical protein
MRRPIALLCALGALAALPASASAQGIGISDQTAATFANPFFPQLKSKYARLITPYDTATDPVQLAKAQAWVQGAESRRQRVLIHFEHSKKSAAEANRLPSVAAYTKQIKAFKKLFPKVREYGVWNEVNRKRDRARGVGQPTAGKYQRLADYYKAMRKVFPGSRYRIVALDILDENNVRPAVTHLTRFQKAIGSKLTRSMVLGFHNYSDTNRFSQSRTRAVLKAFKGKEVWLTETGGLVRFGTRFPYDEARAARALGCMFRLAKSNKKIKRLYIYNYNAPFRPDDPFDAGLVGADGQPRPGFAIVSQRKVGRC